MSTSAIAIIVAVVAVLVVLAALATGLYLNKRRRVSLKEETAEPKSLDKSGGYKAGGGFTFSEGTREAEPVPLVPKAPTAPKTVSEAAPHISLKDLQESREQEAAEAAQAQTDARLAEAEDIDPGIANVAPSAPTEIERIEDEAPEAAPEAPAEADTPADAPAETIAPAAPVAPAEPVAPAAPAEDEAPVAAPSAPKLDEIAPTEGRLDRLKGRLARSQSTVGASLLGLLGAGDLDEESWEEIEDTLLLADLGTPTTMAVVEKLRDRIATQGVANAAEARALLRQVLIEELHPEYDRSIKALPHAGAPSVLLVVGVNGTGKTTTTGKLARVLVADGRRVLLGAADTFRAAAADQLQTWGERVGAEVVRGKEGADPAAVAFDAVARGTEEGVDVVLIDTAGRLHTKTGLMDELDKVKRVVEKKAKVDEVLLVLDATIGQNGLAQAKVFAEVVDITGVVLTKLDGTAKGGIVYAVQHELGVPVKLVGLGEGADDLAPFEPAAFVDALLG
ncbi:signal recognition particle-docking protein FtsY [Tsukamurella ocularis]|uniref:signal recognition particle-docking protein FtsY n=1 Tax=Tsukamurella ocularis TaxID=1970234 RepID=UPI0021680597|nr:signal recognition particle-docking protein FtsY [Tsukamurella ocularis]MCS3780314.1 fused signal recognition particle receptor [Tsukamurella ocularis]MCS3786131.1 fused signal recognition particle receptor [Tsukamurella ocularis]MCS3849495.1 fused signal recognition particle receptor [Tsukamurella ocularis]